MLEGIAPILFTPFDDNGDINTGASSEIGRSVPNGPREQFSGYAC